MDEIDNEKVIEKTKENAVKTTLTIDVREHDLIDYCKANNIEYNTQSLEVGDILLTYGGVGEENIGIESLVFERKTFADLAASIKDGRYREQKQRLKSKYPFHRITYIIEGNIKVLKEKEKNYGMPTSSLISSLISSRYRDGCHIIHTINVEDTMWYLLQIRDRMGEKTIFDQEHGEYTLSLKVKTKKSDNLTPELVYIMQLSQLPGLSTKIAEDIAKVYPCFSELLEGVKNKGLKAFDDVPGIGKARAKKLIEYIK